MISVLLIRPSLLLCCALAAVCAIGLVRPAASQSAGDEAGFQPLFNGADLSGWEVEEGTGLIVQDGVITGNPKGPGIIRTQERFADFELRLEFWIDKGETHEANGGIFFRMGDGDPPGKGYECQISFQDENNCLGSIYGRVPQNLGYVRSIAAEQQWNRVTIRAVGPRIRIWLNDQPIQDCTLHEFRRGHIGVQHHHNGCTVKYRNIRVKPLSKDDAEPGWEPIFNGENLEGWTSKGSGQWRVESGELIGSNGLGNLYYTTREIGDFELRAMAKISALGNGGVLFRSRWQEEDPDGLAVGYECQISNQDGSSPEAPQNVTGAIFGLSPAVLTTRDDAWFSIRISAVGDRLQTWINGRQVGEARDANFAKGLIALQCLTPETTIHFRDILLRVPE